MTTTKFTKENFGEIIDRHRLERKLKQSELGALAGIAAATLSRIKREEIYLKYDTGIAIIKALKLRGQDRIEAEEALKDYVENFQLPNSYEESGSLLKEILDTYNIMPSEISYLIKVSPTFVSTLWKGSKAIPPQTFNKLSRFLYSKGVRREELDNLKRVYTKNMIENNGQLGYLTLQERKRLAALAMSEIG